MLEIIIFSEFTSVEVIRHGSENHAKYSSYTLGVALFGLGKLKLAFQKWFQKPHKSRDLGELILLDDQFITQLHLVAENGPVKVTRKNSGLSPLPSILLQPRVRTGLEDLS